MADPGAERRISARGGTTAALRAATRSAHLDAEDAVDLDAACGSASALAALLARLADGLEAVEAGVAARTAASDVPGELRADWRRAVALRSDAHTLAGILAPEVGSPAPSWSPDEALGAWYVLEGARLGGPVIARAAVRALPEARDALASLAGPGGTATGARWRTFVAWLDERAVAQDEAVAGAREAFALVAAAVRAEDGLAVAG